MSVYSKHENQNLPTRSPTAAAVVSRSRAVATAFGGIHTDPPHRLGLAFFAGLALEFALLSPLGTDGNSEGYLIGKGAWLTR